MRALFLIVFSIINIYLNAQVINDSIRINSYEYEVPKVCGIEFGSSYDHVKKKLEDRYGLYNVIENKGNLSIIDANVGEFKFNFLNFEFQREGNRSYFYYSCFSKYFQIKDFATAITIRDLLWNDIKRKYEDIYIEEYENSNGYRCYKFGINPLDSNRVLGLVTLEKAFGNDGEERIYLNLTYGPIYYIDQSSDF